MSIQATALRTLRVEGLCLDSGEQLDAEIRYRTYGRYSAEAGNCVLVFSYYTGTDQSYLPWIGPGRPLDPARHFVVMLNHLGGGVSSSPSSTRGRFPAMSIADNARAARLVLDELGVDRVRLAAGWSLGGIQSLEFALQNPGTVEAVLALCSAARCAPVNQVFLDSVAAALEADPRFAAADPQDPPLAGLDAFGRIYAGWAYSEAFYTDRLHREFGDATAEDVLTGWGRDHQAMDAGDLMASLQMWRAADLGAGRGGLEAALTGLQARTILMPSTTDAYFTLEENRRTAVRLPRGQLRELDSPLGHVAGRPGIRAAEQAQVDRALRDLLADQPPEAETPPDLKHRTSREGR